MTMITAIISFLAASSLCYAVPALSEADSLNAAQVLPSPYKFGYEFGDGLGMTQHRHEESDGTGIVRGKYGYLDPLGVYRNVEYTAGANGYKAIVHSNEPGVSNQNTGDAIYVVQLPPPAAIAQGLRARLPALAV